MSNADPFKWRHFEADLILLLCWLLQLSVLK